MKPRKPLSRISAKKLAQLNGNVPFSTVTGPVGPTRKPIAKVGKQKAKREARNKAYYASAEYKALKKAVHERDGYRCTEMVLPPHVFYPTICEPFVRCPNRGEIVNGKQTARGLVCEETGYQRRGHEGHIDRCKTRCKDCDKRLTSLERANWTRS